MVLGLIGGVGSGKSTVTDILKNEYGFLILKTDDIAKELERPGESVYKKLTEVFGTAILVDDDSKAQSERNSQKKLQDETTPEYYNRAKKKAERGLELRPIDKAKFAQLIYSDNEALKKVNAIVHPAVWSYVREQIREHEKEVGEGAFAAVESALPDAEFEDICEKTWYIYADDETRIERLMKSRGYSKEKCISIIKSQRSADEFKKLADHVIDNSGSEEQTAGQIEELLK
ncbi:MAG: dephospho-CoA kinase [Lachnospiraceae bacterium]|nr:dephospho-CoA kinase [Lachnospiraceae bacterium]